MEKQNLLLNNGKAKIRVTSFLEFAKFLNNKEIFIKKVLDNLKLEPIGYAGFKTKEYFENYFKNQISTERWLKKTYPSEKITNPKLIKIINQIFEKLKTITLDRDIFIFIFPTLSEFVINNMRGVAGTSTWKNTILLDIYPNENWQNQLKIMLTHELAHALSPFFQELDDLRSWLVFEGIAEHFTENLVKGKRNPWTKAIPKQKAMAILNTLIPSLDSKDPQLHHDLFFGSLKYPLWAGYTISYYIIKDWLKTLKELDWKKIINTHPKDIPIEKLASSYAK